MVKKLEPRRCHAWCLFRCMNRPYAVPLECVSEVVAVDRLIDLPLGPPELIGLCTIRREVIPVIALVDGHPAEVQHADGMNAVLVLQAAQGIWGVAINRVGVSIVEETPGEGDSDSLSEEAVGSSVGIRKGDTFYTIIYPEKAWASARASAERWYSLLVRGSVLSSPLSKPIATCKSRSEPIC